MLQKVQVINCQKYSFLQHIFQLFGLYNKVSRTETFWKYSGKLAKKNECFGEFIKIGICKDYSILKHELKTYIEDN